MSIRPEGICGFLISINLYFVVGFTVCCFLESRRTTTVAYGIAVVFSSVLLASVKPSFWLTAVIALLPVATFFLRSRTTQRTASKLPPSIRWIIPGTLPSKYSLLFLRNF
jgi:hypothetical protein